MLTMKRNYKSKRSKSIYSQNILYKAKKCLVTGEKICYLAKNCKIGRSFLCRKIQSTQTISNTSSHMISHAVCLSMFI